MVMEGETRDPRVGRVGGARKDRREGTGGRSDESNREVLTYRRRTGSRENSSNGQVGPRHEQAVGWGRGLSESLQRGPGIGDDEIAQVQARATKAEA